MCAIKIAEKSILGWENSKCKGPGVEGDPQHMFEKQQKVYDSSWMNNGETEKSGRGWELVL